MNESIAPIIKNLTVKTTMPIFWTDLSALSDQIVLARQAIDELRQSHPNSVQSNVKSVYMSPWNSHKLNNKLQPICQMVTVCAKQAIKQFLNSDLTGLNMELSVTDCWGAIYEEADYTIPHKHFPSDISSVLYIEADDGCAPIIFADELVVYPRPNLLVMFPGLLMHSVPQNTGKRVVLVMNMHTHPINIAIS